MQTLSDYFTTAQINAINAATRPATRPAKYTHISDKAWENLYDIAANIGQRLDQKFWDNLNFTVEMHSEAIVCFKGKTERITMPVVYQNTSWAKRLGEMLKRGYRIAWLGEKFCRRITWDNWAATYAQLTAKPKTARQIAYENEHFNEPLSASERSQILERRRREHNFHEVAKVTGRKAALSVEECCYQRESARAIAAEERRTIILEAYSSAIHREMRRMFKGCKN